MKKQVAVFFVLLITLITFIALSSNISAAEQMQPGTVECFQMPWGIAFNSVPTAGTSTTSTPNEIRNSCSSSGRIIKYYCTQSFGRIIDGIFNRNFYTFIEEPCPSGTVCDQSDLWAPPSCIAKSESTETGNTGTGACAGMVLAICASGMSGGCPKPQCVKAVNSNTCPILPNTAFNSNSNCPSGANFRCVDENGVCVPENIAIGTTQCSTAKECQDMYKNCYYACLNNKCSSIQTYAPLTPYPECSSQPKPIVFPETSYPEYPSEFTSFTSDKQCTTNAQCTCLSNCIPTGDLSACTLGCTPGVCTNGKCAYSTTTPIKEPVPVGECNSASDCPCQRTDCQGTVCACAQVTCQNRKCVYGFEKCSFLQSGIKLNNCPKADSNFNEQTCQWECNVKGIKECHQVSDGVIIITTMKGANLGYKGQETIITTDEIRNTCGMNRQQSGIMNYHCFGGGEVYPEFMPCSTNQVCQLMTGRPQCIPKTDTEHGLPTGSCEGKRVRYDCCGNALGCVSEVDFKIPTPCAFLCSDFHAPKKNYQCVQSGGGCITVEVPTESPIETIFQCDDGSICGGTDCCNNHGGTKPTTPGTGKETPTEEGGEDNSCSSDAECPDPIFGYSTRGIAEPDTQAVFSCDGGFCTANVGKVFDNTIFTYSCVDGSTCDSSQCCDVHGGVETISTEGDTGGSGGTGGDDIITGYNICQDYRIKSDCCDIPFCIHEGDTIPCPDICDDTIPKVAEADLTGYICSYDNSQGFCVPKEIINTGACIGKAPKGCSGGAALSCPEYKCVDTDYTCPIQPTLFSRLNPFCPNGDYFRCLEDAEGSCVLAKAQIIV